MTTRPKIIDRDKGYQALRRLVRQLQRDKPAVLVGLVGQTATAPHRGSKAGETVVQIASKHELGVGVPKRAFIGPTIDQHKELYTKGIVAALKGSMRKGGFTWEPVRQSLARLGMKVAGDVKKRIRTGIAPPLSRYTLARKGRRKTTPLIDTGHMWSSITHEVRARTT